VSEETAATLAARVERAVAARARLPRRPLRATVASLAAAARRWREDAQLGATLPEAAGLTPAMVAAVVPLAADVLDEGAMSELVERELGAGALGRPAPDGPAVVAHVLASNVPALALPAIALGCLAGAAVVVKSGRRDPLSAPAFERALGAVDPELAATVVTDYWPGSGDARDETLALADVVIVTGGDDAIAAFAGRVRGRLVAHGPRLSVAAVGADADVEALALDVALYEQRGCLSPHAVYVAGDARAFGARLSGALDAVAERLPPAPAAVAERAAVRVVRDEAAWAPAGGVWSGPGGTVVLDEGPRLRATCGLRTVRVHPVARVEDVAARLPAGGVECVALAGADPGALAAPLRDRGVARVCPPGRMQRPRITWPRGQRAPLGTLLGRTGGPAIEVER
jgi:Acyl-CoA reductase (LuxC)